ncbi:MAG: lipid IV(A) 3-deoxy-D-manno-octulosonic acid transferase [Betaproteobacteria bacterium]|nr:lipid IV(A) 3-deoxy-D-manno-octulosonic acid transferase [Betaproteobacteria bacterium]
MFRLAYNLLLHLALPFLPLRLWWRGRKEPGYRESLGERFGRYGPRPGRPLIWVHAVSLGETRAAQPLVRALRERYPDHALVVTHMTATGRAAARDLYGEVATLAFLPYDFPWAVRRFVAHFHPRLGVLMETELWPNLVRACREAAVPVLLANARLSEKSARGYARVAPLARAALADLAAVGAQTEADAARLRALGAMRVEVTGNLKFDATAPADARARGQALRKLFGDRPVFLAASTRDGEEALLLDALERRPFGAEVLTVIVPRHPQRFEEVAELVRRRGLTVQRRSDNAAIAAHTQLVVGDSMGEMFAYYAACDVAFVGGSLAPYGAQNLIEACAVGTPALIGPSTYNFAQAAEEAVRCGAAVQVADADALVREAARLLGDGAARRRMGEAGRAFWAAHRGATARTMAIVERLLKRE